MKTEHTPEPWFWNEKYGEVCFRSKEDDQSYGMACPVDLTEEANARRIVACVNACAGLPTEVLERYKLGVIGVDYKSTKQQREELLAALENCRLLAARHRNEELAGHVLRFCGESGVAGEVMR